MKYNQSNQFVSLGQKLMVIRIPLEFWYGALVLGYALLLPSLELVSLVQIDNGPVMLQQS